MAVGNYCAKLADDKKEQKKIFEIENICPAILKTPFVSIYLLYRQRELKGKKKSGNFCETFFGSLDRFSCLLQFIH